MLDMQNTKQGPPPKQNKKVGTLSGMRSSHSAESGVTDTAATGWLLLTKPLPTWGARAEETCPYPLSKWCPSAAPA